MLANFEWISARWDPAISHGGVIQITEGTQSNNDVVHELRFA